MGMDVDFSHLSWWLWNGKHGEQRISKGSTMNSSAESVIWELEGLRFPLVMQANVPSSSKSVKQKLNTREIDGDDDVVIVQSDDECVSGSEFDWSIGWLEPHGTGFSSVDDETHETDNGFAVLVPCYGFKYGGMVKEDTRRTLLNNFECFPNSYSDESKKYVENWISSLRNTT